MVAIKGHFDGKVIIPEEPVDLPRNQTLILHIEPEVACAQPEGGCALEWLAQNAVDDPSLPADLSVNIDSYLYGTPKIKP